MVRKTQEDALVTRERILDAAVVMFEEQGVSHTTLDDIARCAGVTRGAIYWHFKDKVDLFSAMVERLVCPLLFKNKAYATRMEENPLAFIRACVDEFIEKMACDRNFFRVFEILWHKCEYVGEMALVRRKYLEEGENHIGILLRAFALAQEQGQIAASLSSRQATIGLVSLIDGLVFNWTKNRALFSMREDAAPILEVFFRGLGAYPAESARVDAGREMAHV
ncbi:MAG: TetR family transcriptional regulator, partial [Zoogloeaceae bacterium]|jgi:TetR/AcrR family acrAB operon transcriptional repressor|nr:TetR family transcriptional regulator [Zoogloeaceae bacterium]